ncbi:hypothetical protein KI387_022975, partial [Taxus chinensis]
MDALVGMQRQGQDIMEHVSSLVQGLSSSLHGHMRDHIHEEKGVLMWPRLWQGIQHRKGPDRVRFNKSSVAVDPMGAKLGQVVADFRARLSGVVQDVVQHLPLPRTCQRDDALSDTLIKQPLSGSAPAHMDYGVGAFQREFNEEFEDMEDIDDVDFHQRMRGRSRKPQVSVSVSTTYNSRTQDIESSVVATRDNWRAEVSVGGSSSGNSAAPLFIFQQCPLFVVRDTTFLLNLHSSEQHSLWYGFDRKNGLHSLCPVVWSKESGWCLLSMICANSLSCPFIDLQFPNGQITYAAGEGLSTKAFVPAFGGFLQAQCHYPGETKLSFSCKNRWGTCVTPAVQWPDKSLSFCMVQPLPWQSSGPIFQPTTQLSVTPTFGGRNGGLKAEVVHTVRDKLSFACGGACTINPSAFASVS